MVLHAVREELNTRELSMPHAVCLMVASDLTLSVDRVICLPALLDTQLLQENANLNDAMKETGETLLEWVLQLVLFGLLHWALAVLLLLDLAARKRVRGGRKAPWALAIMFLTFLGSLVYMLCHPGVFLEDDDDNDMR